MHFYFLGSFFLVVAIGFLWLSRAEPALIILAICSMLISATIFFVAPVNFKYGILRDFKVYETPIKLIIMDGNKELCSLDTMKEYKGYLNKNPLFFEKKFNLLNQHITTSYSFYSFNEEENNEYSQKNNTGVVKK